MTELAILGGRPEIDRPLAPFSSIGADEVAAARDVVESGILSGFLGAPGEGFLGGPRVRALEDSWAARFSTRFAISMNSATSGLFAAAGAIGIGPGDEVIVPPYTMSATAVAPLIYGGIPVFADIDDATFCLDVASVEAALTSRTKAIFAVNLFGHPAPLAALRELADARGIYLIEDSAQAPLASEHGRLAGTVGHIGIFSLNRHKHIQTGEGGICVTDDSDLATRLRLIRNHGENLVEHMAIDAIENLIGFNFRLTEVSAAIAQCQLDRADAIVDERESRARKLSEILQGVDGLTVPIVREGCRHTYYVWSATIDPARFGVPRAVLAEAIRMEGAPIHEGYVRPLYKLPLFQRRIAIGGDGFPFTAGSAQDYSTELCPVCESLYAERLIWFGICDYQLPENDIERVGAAIAKVCDNRDALAQAYRDGDIGADERSGVSAR